MKNKLENMTVSILRKKWNRDRSLLMEISKDAEKVSDNTVLNEAAHSFLYVHKELVIARDHLVEELQAVGIKIGN